METTIYAVALLGAFIAGILVERHNATRINAALADAQKLFTIIETKFGVVKTATGASTIPASTIVTSPAGPPAA